MQFTKIQNGEYYFKGIDSLNGQEIEGHILYKPYDVKFNEVWAVVFGKDTDNQNTAFRGKTLKSCKKWLTA